MISTESNIVSTNSEIVNIAIVSTVSNIRKIKKRIASISHISSKSTIDIGVDSYGNKIEYNIENWIGEDDLNENNNQLALSEVMREEKDSTYIENFGKLSISIVDLDKFNKANVDLSLLDKNYNIHIIHLYYRKDYSITLDIFKGDYKINSVNFVDSNKNNNFYYSSKNINIEENKLTELKLYSNKKNVGKEKYEIFATTSVADNVSNIKVKKSFSGIIIGLIIIILAIIGAFIYIKKRRNG